VSGLTNHCRERNVAHPNILTEAGRAMTAHHAVLITNVIDVDPADQAPSFQLPDTDEHPLLQALLESKRQLNMNNAAAVARKSRQLLNELQQDFINNHTTLEQRAQGEGTYALITEQARDFLRHSGEDSGLLDELNERLARKYFCNYSLFQSMPDAWAIDQIFPILPLHRLNEEPDQRGIIEDITCDSDGRINLYVDAKGIEHSLPLHAPRPGEPYLLGFFLVGAYQEILGDMHNLFGDTHSINVRLDSSGKVLLEEPLAGDNVGDLLRYVHFDPENLIASLRLQLQASQASESEQQQMLAELTEGMHGYSYFED